MTEQVTATLKSESRPGVILSRECKGGIINWDVIRLSVWLCHGADFCDFVRFTVQL